MGDCWFIGALSVIACDEEYLRGKFKPDAESIKEISNEEVE